MSGSVVEKVADAVLYEGYLLYPYRASAVKNRQRWNFGVLYPRVYSEAQCGSDDWTMQTECLVIGSGSRVELKVRFLQLTVRAVAELARPAHQWSDSLPFHRVDTLNVDGRIYRSWQEAIERDLLLPDLSPAELVRAPVRRTFRFPAEVETEPLRDAFGRVAGALFRRREAIEIDVEAAAAPIAEGLFRLRAVVSNATVTETRADPGNREAALPHSLASAHTILRVTDGEFVSLLDPPEGFRKAVDDCVNFGTWPVLAGDEGSRDAMLSSPIILYDYPKIADESPGELFDGTEIDEILTLRIMTMTDDEKHEMRHVDERARRILERTESLGPADMSHLHGTFRHVTPTLERPHE